MSRRVLAPVLLLLAAACSVAAVFAVHRIESRGGPLAQPSATTYFSPNGDGVQDEAEVRFTTRQPERVTVEVEDERGIRVTTLAADELVDGEVRHSWDGGGVNDGATVADGTYRFIITRAGDDRTYSPTTPTVVDTDAPIGILDRATLELGELRGLALLGVGERLEVFERQGSKVSGIRQFAANPDSAGARPSREAPRGTNPIRFTVSLAGTPLRIDVVDLAGNRRTVFPDPDVDYRANG